MKIVLKTRTIFLVAIVLLIISSNRVYSSHIIGGYIYAEKIEDRTYNVTFVGYTDTGSGIEFGGGTLDLGDGTVIDGSVHEFEKQRIYSGPQFTVFEFSVVHTYSSPGSFRIFYNEMSRTTSVNMNNGDLTPFYVETILVLDPIIENNSTPKLNQIPVFFGKADQKWISHFTATSAKDEYLEYSVAIPLMGPDQPVSDYRLPDNSEFYPGLNGEAVFSIDKFNGTAIWDSPGTFTTGVQTNYTLAFRIKKVNSEGLMLSSTLVDFQVTLDENQRSHEFTLPDELCTAGSSSFTVEAINEPFFIRLNDPSRVSSINELDPGVFLEQEFNGSNTLNIDFQPAVFNNVSFDFYFSTDSLRFGGITYTISDQCDSLNDVINFISPEQSDRLVIFPNPVKEKVVKMSGSETISGPIRFSIINMEGKVVHDEVILPDHTEIVLDENLKSGLYVYSIQSISGKLYKRDRLIIE